MENVCVWECQNELWLERPLIAPHIYVYVYNNISTIYKICEWRTVCKVNGLQKNENWVYAAFELCQKLDSAATFWLFRALQVKLMSDS